MRRHVLAAVSVLILTAGVAAFADGGEKGTFELGPYVGNGWLDDYRYLHPQDDILFGLRFGYFLTAGWSTELSLQRLSTTTDISLNTPGLQNQDVDMDACRLNMLYNFGQGSRFRPFVTAGVGCEKFDASSLGQTSGLGVNAGGGLRFFMGDHFALRLDGRFVSTKVEIAAVDERQNNVEATLGVSFLFGGGPPKDSDGDGVSDGKDDCPDTPSGAIVDAKGCPKDSDGDGVYDGIDQCPDTPRGVPVDTSGCPRDSDGDGVFDGTDQCPDTPRGATVDAKGCPSDGDGDGVYDGIDRCPDTPRGAKVDASGCPLDGDGDGVFDGLDQCPDTPKGDKVDARGCTIAPARTPTPMIQLLLEKKPVVLEGVEFDIDKATLRPVSYTTLDEVAASLKEWPELRIEIQGHTDSTGTSAHNQGLSNRRAESVRAYLVAKGIDGSRLDAKGYGEDSPVADNKTREGKQRNRRVELHKVD